MKRINSIMFAAVAILAAASCQKEMTNEPETTGEPFSFTATIGDDTKTALSDGTKVVWTKDDKVSVFDQNGEPVEFSTAITEPQATATFSADAFEPNMSAEKLVALYPAKAEARLVDGTITNVHIGGTQTAIAGSFDPTYARAYGEATMNLNPEFRFTSIHTLFKFTVKAGSTAPSKVTLTNNGMQMIAGLTTYDPAATGDNDRAKFTFPGGSGAKEVSLNGSFEAGKTYYIVTVPFVTGSTTGITVSFDGVQVKTFKPAADFAFNSNTIYNLGTLEKPAAVKTPTVKMNATSVLAKQSEGETSWLTSLEGGTANMDRNAAFDGTNVYIAKVGNGIDPAIYAIPLTDPENVSMVNMIGVSGGYFPISCVRTIKNGDNNQILLASNMAMDSGDYVKVYAWKDGVNSAPTSIIANWTIPTWASRRFGDQFTVCGDWTKGEMWFKDMNAGAIGSYNIVDGAISGELNGWGTIGGAYLGSVYRYNVTDPNMLIVPGASDAYLYNLNTTSSTEITKSYGYIGGLTPFTYNGKQFIAYVTVPELGAKTAKLVVIEDQENSFSALNDNLVVFEQDLNAPDNNQTIGNGTGMCCNVVTVGTKTYLFGHAQNIGFAVYEITGLTEL